MAPRRGRVWSDELFRLLPRPAKVLFYAAVFSTFAPLALLFELGGRPHTPLHVILLWAAYSGLVAVGFALSFTWSLRLLPVVIGTSLGLPMLFGQSFWGRSLDLHTVLVLAGSIALMALGYAGFVRFIGNQGVTSLRLRTEINLARAIHEGLVPPLDRRVGRVEVYGDSAPTTEVGGDLLDLVEDGERAGLYVADVSGHGVPAGVLMAMIKSGIRMQWRRDGDLGRLVGDLNTLLFEVKRDTMFATFAGVHWDGSRTLEFALAGHLPILWWRADTRRMEKLENEHPPLGVLESHAFRSRRVEPRTGDLFVLVTDGLTEVLNRATEEFGEERLVDVIRANSERPLREIHAALLDAVHGFGPQTDDQTLVLLRCG
jgi:hypothetical protein